MIGKVTDVGKSEVKNWIVQPSDDSARRGSNAKKG